jgi:hypothetical protein
MIAPPGLQSLTSVEAASQTPNKLLKSTRSCLAVMGRGTISLLLALQTQR